MILRCVSKKSIYEMIAIVLSQRWKSILFFFVYSKDGVWRITVRIWGLETAKKVWRGYEYLFHVYLMRGSQKYQENWNPMVVF